MNVICYELYDKNNISSIYECYMNSMIRTIHPPYMNVICYELYDKNNMSSIYECYML